MKSEVAARAGEDENGVETAGDNADGDDNADGEGDEDGKVYNIYKPC